MSGARTQAAAQRREAILAAALRCFLAKGFAATTIDDIRRQSGASIASISHQFETKEQLADALYRDALSRDRAGFLATIESAADAREDRRCGAFPRSLNRRKCRPRALPDFSLGDPLPARTGP